MAKKTPKASATEAAETPKARIDIVYKPLADIKPYAKNPRRNDAAVGPVAESIKRFGFKVPIIIDKDGTIVAGHTRYKAALKLGLTEVPTVSAADLTPAQVKAFRLADNKTAEMAGWDFEILGIEMDELKDMGLDFSMEGFGFDMAQFGKLGDGEENDADDIEPVEGEDDVPEVEDGEPPDSERGAVYVLGNHRLMCGDSTDSAAVKKLMRGERADICFTSPPYNMKAGKVHWDQVPKTAMRHGSAYGEFSDDLTDDEYAALLANALKNALASADDALFNIGILGGSKKGIARMLEKFQNNICDIVVWNKSQSMPSGLPSHKAMLSHRCELIFCFNQTGSRSFSHPQWSIGTEINRIDTRNASGNEFAGIHAATFPVEFAEYVCRKYAEKSVLDLFGGTGTTMIAAEKSGRKCYMMELDPVYCDVIRKRWAEFTHGEGCDWKSLAKKEG